MMDLTGEIDRPRITKVTVKRDAVGIGKESLFHLLPEKGSRPKNHFRLFQLFNSQCQAAVCLSMGSSHES